MSDIEQRVVAEIHQRRLHHGRGGADADLAKTGCEQQGLEPCRVYTRVFLAALAAEGLTIVPTALVEAALAWRKCDFDTLVTLDADLCDAIDAYREATR